MAISHRATGSWAYAASGSVTPTLPTHSTGDMLLVRVAYKSSNLANCLASTATSGWAKVGEFVGTGNSGNGTGGVNVAVFWKIAASASETNPTIDFSQTVTQVGHVGISYQKAGGDPPWATPVGAGGEDTTADTSKSMTMGSHVSVIAGDMVDFFLGVRDDCTMTSPSLTQTGVTYAAVSEQPATAGTDTSGADGAYDGGYRLASSGTSSAAAVITGTLNTSETGSAWMTRLRAEAAAVTITPTPVTIPIVAAAPTVAAGVVVTPDPVTIPVSPTTPTVAAGVVVAPRPVQVIILPITYDVLILGDAPKGYWRLGEPSGTVAADSSGLGHDGTYSGTITLAQTGAISGDADTAAKFLGSGGNPLVTVGDHADFDLGDGPLSIEMWARRNADTGATEWLLQKGTGGYGLYLASTDNGLRFAKVGGGSFIARRDAVWAADGSWHHFVATKNGSTTVIYYDGADVTSVGADETLTDTTTDLTIGDVTGPLSTYDWTLDEVAIYNVALTPEQVLRHYLVGLESFPVTLDVQAGATTVTPDPVVVPIVATTPTLAIGQVLTPDAVAVPILATDPTVSAGVVITPDPVTIPVSVTAPTVTAGALVTPDPVEVPLIVPAPTIAVGALVNPDAVAIPILATAPTIAVGRVLTPDAVPVPVLATDPTVTAGVAVTPDPVAVVVDVPAPTLSIGGSVFVAPDPVVIQVVATAPTIEVGALILPDPATIPVSVPDPTISVGVLVAPDPVVILIALTVPSVDLGGSAVQVSPDPVVVSLEITEPVVAVGIGVGPDPVVIGTAVPPVTLTLEMILSPDPVLVVIAVPAPSVVANSGDLPRRIRGTISTRRGVLATVTGTMSGGTIVPVPGITGEIEE